MLMTVSQQNADHFLFFYASLTSKIMCVSGGKKSFFKKFCLLCFLITPVLRFVLLPTTKELIRCYWSLPIPGKIMRKPEILLCFQRLQKVTSGMKWFKLLFGKSEVEIRDDDSTIFILFTLNQWRQLLNWHLLGLFYRTTSEQCSEECCLSVHPLFC